MRLTCPACLLKEIDPVFLRTDPDDQSIYCLKCTYVARNTKELRSAYAKVRAARLGLLGKT